MQRFIWKKPEVIAAVTKQVIVDTTAEGAVEEGAAAPGDVPATAQKSEKKEEKMKINCRSWHLLSRYVFNRHNVGFLCVDRYYELTRKP